MFPRKNEVTKLQATQSLTLLVGDHGPKDGSTIFLTESWLRCFGDLCHRFELRDSHFVHVEYFVVEKATLRDEKGGTMAVGKRERKTLSGEH